MKPRRSTRAFSLIELIVTISIITVLIGILLPVLPKVRDAAKRTACGANLRSVGQAIEMYKNEFDELFPVARYMPPPWLTGDEDPPLNETLDEFMEADSPSWACPGDDFVATATYVDEDDREQVCGVSYTYVVGLSGQRFEDTFFYERLNFGPDRTPIAHDFDGGTFEKEAEEGQEIGELVTVDFFHDTRNLLFVDGSVGRYGER